MPSVITVLKDRGFISAMTDEGLEARLNAEKITMYAGFDPTADSLHLGHFVPIMAMAHFQRHGHKVLALVGGATGMVGDPSGRSDERNLLTREQVEGNTAAIKGQLARFLSFDGGNAATMIDNYDWIGKFSFIDWLRDVGKHFTINYMMAKDSVKQRLSREGGISYTEFSYMTMQAYDFLHLFRTHNCTLQAGGNDQWGNITAGTDLIHKAAKGQAYGVTFPLITTSSGEKFGKSSGNAVWLDANRTSPYQFYQYWIQVADADVERFLKLFTFLELDEIASICRAHSEAPERREGQKRLAAEITRNVHGEEGLRKATEASQALFGGALTGLAKQELLDIFADVPSSELSRADLGQGLNVLDLVVKAGAAASKGEARRAIDQGGLYVNNERVSGQDAIITPDRLLADAVLVLRFGKKRYHLVKVV